MTDVTPGEPNIVVVADPEAAADAAAHHIATSLTAAVATRGRADWATTGGSSPIGIYRHLLEPQLFAALPWAETHVWFGDDRYVPRDHPLSNVKPFDDILLDIGTVEEGTAGGGRHGVPLPIDHLHPFHAGEAIAFGRGIEWCATDLADTLRAAGLPTKDGWPVFDLMLIGIGSDGHLLSVFPGSAAIDSTELALAIPAPSHIEPHVQRVTLNPALIGVASDVLIVVTGSSKADVIGEIFGSARDVSRWPAQFARRAGATWILDAEAAAAMPRVAD